MSSARGRPRRLSAPRRLHVPGARASRARPDPQVLHATSTATRGRPTTSGSSSWATRSSVSSSASTSTASSPTSRRARSPRSRRTWSPRRRSPRRGGTSGSAGSCGWARGRPAPAARRSSRSSPTPSRPSSPRSTWTAACRGRGLRPEGLRAGRQGHRHRRPLLPRLQDGSPGDGAGSGPAAAGVPGRRGVRPGPREGVRGRALVGRRRLLLRAGLVQARGPAQGRQGSAEEAGAAPRLGYGAFASLSRNRSAFSKPTRRRSFRSLPCASRKMIVGTPRIPYSRRARWTRATRASSCRP